MVDLVFGEIDLPGAGVDWKTAMRERYGDEFEYGLDMILDGLARARESD